MNEDYKPYEVTNGKELEIVDDKNDNLYAGDWVQNKIEDSDDMISIGTYDDRIRGPLQILNLDINRLSGNQSIITGQNVVGKKNLLTNMSYQVVESDFGLVSIIDEYDPNLLLDRIPEEKYEDVIYINPADFEESGIGFNLLGLPVDETEQLSESSRLSSIFVSMIKYGSDNWGPKIGNITETVVKQLIRAEDPFNMIDLVAIMTDKEEREAFAQNYGDDVEQVFMERNKEEREAFAQNYGDDVEQVFMDRIANQDKDAFSPVLRRLRNWVGNRSIRKISCNSNSEFSLLNAIRNEKIVIFDLSGIDYERDILVAMILARLRFISEYLTEDSEAFVTFDTDMLDGYISFVVQQIMNTNSLGFILQTNKLGKYEKDIRQNLKNSEVKISFCCGNDESEASRIGLLYNTSSDRILNLGKNECISYTMTEDGNISDDALDTTLFRPLPPIRRANLDVLHNSCKDIYGSNLIDANSTDFGVSRFLESQSDTDG